MAVNTRLANAPIVLDNGSGTTRAGFAGEDVPKCFFPAYVGRPKHVRAMAGALEGDVFVGARAQGEARGLLKISYPLAHGIVTDWDDMERIWQYVYAEGLKTLSEDVGWPLSKHGEGLTMDSTRYSSRSHR
jgi:centractin